MDHLLELAAAHRLGHPVPADAASLDLNRVPVGLRERAREAFTHGDLPSFFATAPSAVALELFLVNALAFFRRDLYEKGLLRAYLATHSNHARWGLHQLAGLFHNADRRLLRQAGDPLPPGKRFTLYRGVAGMAPYRKEAGYSWTSSPGMAAWFATRQLGLADPAVVVTEVRARDVLAYASDCGREDYILRATHWRRMDTLPEPVKP